MNTIMWLGFLLIGIVSARHDAYDGQTLYTVQVQDVGEALFFTSLAAHLNLDVWVPVSPGRDGVVLVPNNLRRLFQNELSVAEITYEIEVLNIKELLDLEDRLLKETSHIHNKTGLSFKKIYTYTEVDTYLNNLAILYPAVVSVVNAGQSFEGRNINYLKISTSKFQTGQLVRQIRTTKQEYHWIKLGGRKPTDPQLREPDAIASFINQHGVLRAWEEPNKPIVFIQSLLHAREWITLPVTLYVIHKLVIDVTDDEMAQDVDWIILPIANPDGYEYSRNKFRFWRKNRSTGNMIGNTCVGVDLNRNYDINWSLTSSQIPCSETFHGYAPFSEPETAITRDIILEHGDRIKLFLDIHSFGSMILYGYGTGELPGDAKTLNLVGVKMAAAIDNVKLSWNPNYTVGNVAEVLYKASGSAQDYTQAVGVPFSYTIELPGYRYGLGTGLGFFVDPNFIEQAGMETWEGIKIGTKFILDNFRMN